MIVDGNNMYMIRGDSEIITVSCTDQQGEDIKFVTGQDTVYFTVKVSPSVTTKIFQKVITTFDATGVAVVEINPEDTKLLSYREYKYDIQWTKHDGTIKTLVPMSSLFIQEEITFE